jgi:hypothetical protein
VPVLVLKYGFIRLAEPRYVLSSVWHELVHQPSMMIDCRFVTFGRLTARRAATSLAIGRPRRVAVALAF